MLRVPTYVAPSSIAGVGLFAGVSLPTGAVVWQYDEGVDWRISSEDLERFPEPYGAWLRPYLYREPSGVYVLCGDNAKFMNHADEPNCDDDGEIFTIALRPIAAGEELTCDYRLFDRDTREFGFAFQEATTVG